MVVMNSFFGRNQRNNREVMQRRALEVVLGHFVDVFTHYCSDCPRYATLLYKGKGKKTSSNLCTILTLFFILCGCRLLFILLFLLLQSSIRMAQVPSGCNNIPHKGLESFDFCRNENEPMSMHRQQADKTYVSTAYLESRHLAFDPKAASPV